VEVKRDLCVYALTPPYEYAMADSSIQSGARQTTLKSEAKEEGGSKVFCVRVRVRVCVYGRVCVRVRVHCECASRKYPIQNSSDLRLQRLCWNL